MSQRQPIEIFCCAAEADRSFLEQLRTQLAVQEQQGLLTFWEKSQIQVGADAPKEIQKHLASAGLFLLLISADFLADSYCYDTVLKAALEMHVRGDALVIPVLVRRANYQAVPVLNRMQVFPRSALPIAEQHDRDKALWEVTNEINKAIPKIELPLIEPNSKKPPIIVPSSPEEGRPSRKFSRLTGGALVFLLLSVVLAITLSRPLLTSQPAPSATSTHSNPTVPNTLGGSSPTAILNQPITPTQSSQPSLKWTFQTGNSGSPSSPMIVNGVLYIGSSDGNIYAIDINTDQRKWTFHTGGIVSASPTVVNGVVYVGSDDGKEYAINASTGQKIWATQTGAQMFSSATVVNGLLYVGSGNDGKKVYALDATTGQQKWTFSTSPGGVYSSPVVVNGILYIGSGDGKVYALTLPA